MTRRKAGVDDPMRDLMRVLGKADAYDAMTADMEGAGPRSPEHVAPKLPPRTRWERKRCSSGVGDSPATARCSCCPNRARGDGRPKREGNLAVSTSDDGFPAEADIDALLAEFGGDARAAIGALLHDLAMMAADCEATVSRGFVRGALPGAQRQKGR